MEKKTNNEPEPITNNDAHLIIQELKKIIGDWESGKLYRLTYDRGVRGELLYLSIILTIAYGAEDLFDTMRENIKKKFEPDIEIDSSIYSKSDIRSIVFEVLNFLEGMAVDPVENLIPEDIPIILEFLDTPPGKSLEAWDKWEQYWPNLDYPERRRKLLEYNELKTPTFPEDQYLTHTKTKITIGRLNHYSEQDIMTASEIFDKVKKEFKGKKITHERIDLLDKDTSRIFNVCEDGAFINLITRGKLEQIDREATFQEIKAMYDKWQQDRAQHGNTKEQKEVSEYYDLKMLGFPENSYLTNVKTSTSSITYHHNERRTEKVQEVFNSIKKEFHGRKLTQKKTEVIDSNTARIIYEFEDGSCIQLIINCKS